MKFWNLKSWNFSKGAVPIPYIIAFLLAIGVVGVLGYFTYSSSGRGMGATTEAICDSQRVTYCNSLIYGGPSTWKSSCGSPPTVEECLAGGKSGEGGGGADGGDGGGDEGDGGDGGDGEIYTCKNYKNQRCKNSCDSDDAGVGRGTCPAGKVCCLAKPPSPRGIK